MLLDRLMSGKAEKRPPRILLPPERVVPRQSTDAAVIDDREVATALNFIRQRGCDSIQVSDVLGLVQLSRSTLKRRFKAITGRTVLAEIQRVRVECAEQLLLTTDLGLKHIAARSGFNSTQ